MTTKLSTLICCVFILVLLGKDQKKNSDCVSEAIWIPLIWMFIAGSRFAGHWLNLGVPISMNDPVAIYNDGSPIDRAIFSVLMVTGIFILIGRKLNWGRLIVRNKWLSLYLLYCAISIVWVDYPFTSFKRWIKDLGTVVMALVVLTEVRPYEAAMIVLRRLAFLLIPLSILLIRYYPELGRSYHMGKLMVTGVATQKNGLGAICLISGIYFCWNVLQNRRGDNRLERSKGFGIDVLFVGLIAWLFYQANSVTSLACMVVAAGVLLVGAIPSMARKPGRIIALLMGGIALYGILEALVGLSDLIFVFLGRSADFTSRKPLWYRLIGMVEDPIFGFGYQNFLSGDRLRVLWEEYGQIMQPHNGYLEIYLNLGLVGVVLLVSYIISGLLNVRRDLRLNLSSGIWRLCFVITVGLYNWTESSLVGLSNMWVMLLISIIDISGQRCIASRDKEVDRL